jgi:hypothetical protein
VVFFAVSIVGAGLVPTHLFTLLGLMRSNLGGLWCGVDAELVDLSF